MLKGIFPPLVTPFEDDEVSYNHLAENIKKYNKKNLAGYVVFGSNGESVFLTQGEKLKILSAVKENASPDKIIIAGTGLESIKETIMLTNESAKNGADYALIITPSFFKSAMNHKALVSYYTTVADSVSIPVIIYNVTKFTNVNIEAETVSELSQHRNIVGIKNSNENLADLTEIISKTPPLFNTLVGTGSILLPGLIAGSKGGILALANIAPDECYEIYELFSQNEFVKAKTIQERMIPVNRAVTSQFGVAGLKAAMDILGYYGGSPRKPLSPLSQVKKEELKKILIQNNLLEY